MIHPFVVNWGNCWLTNLNIVLCCYMHMLRPFANPVACLRMLLVVVGSCSLKFETGQTFTQHDATTPKIVGPTMLGVITCVCTLFYSNFVTGLFINAFPQSQCITTKFILWLVPKKVHLITNDPVIDLSICVEVQTEINFTRIANCLNLLGHVICCLFIKLKHFFQSTEFQK